MSEARKTILVVDGEPTVLNFANLALRRAGFRVLAVGSGAKALVLCREHPEEIDLALLDLSMPGMNGPELRDCLRNQFPGIRILFMSGYGYEEMESLGVKGAPEDFIPKPFTVGVLKARIREALEGSRSLPGATEL